MPWIRYHLKRLAQEVKDGRAKFSLIEQLELVETVDHWWKDQIELLPKPPSTEDVVQLSDRLRALTKLRLNPESQV